MTSKDRRNTAKALFFSSLLFLSLEGTFLNADTFTISSTAASGSDTFYSEVTGTGGITPYLNADTDTMISMAINLPVDGTTTPGATFTLYDSAGTASVVSIYQAGVGALTIENVGQTITFTDLPGGQPVTFTGEGGSGAITGLNIVDGTVKFDLEIAGSSINYGGALSGSGAVQMTNTSNHFNTARIVGAISGARSIAVNAANMILSGINTYTGGTVISSGATLVFDGPEALPLNTAINNAGVLEFAAPLSSPYHGAISGAGIIQIEADTTFSGLNNIFTGDTNVLEGTLTVSGTLGTTGSHTGSVIVYDGGTLCGTGDIYTVSEVDVYGTLENTDLTGALTINGDLVFSPSSYYTVGYNIGEPITVTGSVDLNGNTWIFPNEPLTSIPQEEYIVLRGGGGIGGLIGAISELIGVFNVEYDIGNYSEFGLGSGTINTEVKVTLTSQFELLADGLNRKLLGSVIDQTFFPATGDLATDYLALLPLSTEQYNDALGQMDPAQFKQAAVVQQKNAVAVRDALSLRMQSILDNEHCKKSKSCEQSGGACEKTSGASLWADGFGDIVNQKSLTQNTNYYSGYHNHSAGVVAGLDYQFATHYYAGILGAYSNSDVKWKNHLDRAKISSYYGGLYFSVIGEMFYANLSAIGSHNNFKEVRKIQYGSINLQANNTHGGNQLISHIDTGLNFGVKGFSIRPFDSFDYIAQSEKGYTETGANALNLRVQKTTMNMARNELGLNFAKCVSYESSKITLDAKFSWVREMRFKGQGYVSQLVGTGVNFDSAGYYPNRNLFSPGVSLTASAWEDRLLVSAYYVGQYNNLYKDSEFGGQLRYSF